MSTPETSLPAVGSQWKKHKSGLVVVVTRVGPNTLDGRPHETRVWHEGATAKSKSGTSIIENFLKLYAPLPVPDPALFDMVTSHISEPLNGAFPTQKYLHGDQDIPGDCWRTAIAGLVGADRDDVPHFAHLYGADAPELAWWDATVAWVEKFKPGWTLTCLKPVFPVYLNPELAPRIVIASGASPRSSVAAEGLWHSVLVDAITGALVWDPHPDRTGLASEPYELAGLTHIDTEEGASA